MKKEQLVKRLVSRINEAPIGYEGPERMSPDIQSKFEKGETPHSGSKAFPEITPEGPDKPSNFEQLIASQRFKEVINRLKRYTGLQDVTSQNAMMQLQMMVMSAMQEIAQIESENKEYLEELAIEVVQKEFAIPEGSLQYDVKLVQPNDIDSSKLSPKGEEPSEEEIENMFGSEEEQEQLEDFMDSFEQFDLEKAKRRFINSLIQGAAKQSSYMFELLNRELNAINPRLLNLYGVFMSFADSLYWLMPDSMVQGMAGDGESTYGMSELDAKTDPPTVKARGVNLPILIHELAKGVMEIAGTYGLPKDKTRQEAVINSQDTVVGEIWDMRLGPVIWQKFRESYPDELFDDDKRNLQQYFLVKFAELTPNEFFAMAREILSGSPKGKKMVKDMVDEIVEELKGYEYEDTMKKYEDDDDDDDDEDFDDFLKGLGIN
jgi:hypothetical protein